MIKLKLKKKKIEAAVTRIRTWDTSATTKGTDHYTTTAIAPACWIGKFLPIYTKNSNKENVRIHKMEVDNLQIISNEIKYALTIKWLIVRLRRKASLYFQNA